MNHLDDTRPTVQLPGNNRLLSDFAAELGKGISKANVFKRGMLTVTLNEQCDGLAVMSPEKMRTWIEQHAVCCKTHRVTDDETVVSYRRTMSRADAEGVLASPQFLEQLRPIERVNSVRLPVLREDGYIKLLPEGYDAESRTLTLASSVVVVDNLPLPQARQILDKLLGEFRFSDNGRSKAVAISAMLSLFAASLLPKNSLRPCFIYLANAEGAGKTLLVKFATVPVLGSVPASCKPRDEEEMRKTLLTAIIEAKPVLFFDNIKGRLASEALEAFITTQEWSGRVLGVSKTFAGRNLVTVFVTGNGCTVSPDMRRRSLFCELFIEAERPEDREFKQRLEVPEILERRSEILSALLSLVRHWDSAMRPKPSHCNSSFPEWSDIIGGIVEHAGYGCPLEAANIQEAADVDGADMRTLVDTLGDGANVTFGEIVKIARQHDLFGEYFLGDHEQLDHTNKARLASLLRRYGGRLIGGARFSLEGTGRKRRYKVEKAIP